MGYRYFIVMIEEDAPSAESGTLARDYYASPHIVKKEKKIVKKEKKNAEIEVWDDDRKLSYHTFALKHLDHEHCL